MSDIAHTLDASGMACPMPVVRTRQAIDQLSTGDILKVISTDRGSCSDIPAWAESSGHVLKEQREEGGTYVFLVEKG